MERVLKGDSDKRESFSRSVTCLPDFPSAAPVTVGMAGMDSYVIVILVLCALTALGNGEDAITKARSCSDIRKFYTGKGYGLDEVPLSEISGTLQIPSTRSAHAGCASLSFH